MERPKPEDFKSKTSNTIYFGDYLKACEKYDKYLRDQIKMPDPRNDIDGTGLMQRSRCQIKLDRYFEKLEGVVNYLNELPK